MHNRFLALIAVSIAVAQAGCGSSATTSSPASSSSSPSATSTSASTSGVSPNQRETLPPGDIPDTIAYVPYAVPGAGISVSTPEGWSRSSAGGTVTFTDKLNEIQLFVHRYGHPVTAAAARRIEVPKLAASVRTFKLQSISRLSRPAGPAIRISYLGDSRPNPVTGKVGTLAFERYDFFHHGREVVLLLSSPRGSDNVDPWHTVTSSLRFTR
ncbi:MAG: hypothetical protein ACR2NR_13125 [Solirubrobacteraceae bacterium]